MEVQARRRPKSSRWDSGGGWEAALLGRGEAFERTAESIEIRNRVLGDANGEEERVSRMMVRVG